MPWAIADVDKHISGLNTTQKHVWIRVANSARTRCIQSGKSEKTCDASAIKQANAVARHTKVSEEGAIVDDVVWHDELGWVVDITEHYYEVPDVEVPVQLSESALDSIVSAFAALRGKWLPTVELLGDVVGKVKSVRREDGLLLVTLTDLTGKAYERVSINGAKPDKAALLRDYLDTDTGRKYISVLRSLQYCGGLSDTYK